MTHDDPRRDWARSPAALVCAAALAIAAVSGLIHAWRPPPAPDPPTEGPAGVQLRINPNTDGADRLALLPGIGPTLATRIIEHRAEHGPFGSADDLRRVRGIGPKTVDALRGRISLAPPDESTD